MKDEIKRLIDSNLDTKSRLENLERKGKTIFECLDVLAHAPSDDELKNLNWRLDKLIARYSHIEPKTSDFCPICHLPKPVPAWKGYVNTCTCPPDPMEVGTRIDAMGHKFPPASDPITERLETIEALLREVLEVLKPEPIPYTGGYPKESEK
jgi:hypothetical protein